MALLALTTRLVTTVLVVGAVTLGTLPADAAVATAKTSLVAAAVAHQDVLSLQGDTQFSNARSRRAAKAWKGRKILFTESLPAKWDWSLSTALSKWNTAGGGIRFVRTTKVRKARLNISYGNIGGAAGMATVGKARHAWVKLSSTYNGYDALDAHNRVEVMAVLAHELGHVLGFGHTSASCSLMSPLMDVDGCGMVPDDRPGYYKCRTIDTPLVARFVRMYGGHARLPASWCPIEAIPSALTGVLIARGSGSSLDVRWRAPASVASGSRVQIGTWQSPQCGATPTSVGFRYAPASAGQWRDDQVEPSGTTCVSVRMVNRYGAGTSPAAASVAF